MELRFFGGLSVEETAEVLKISEETVMRDWKFAKNWLMRELSRGSASKKRSPSWYGKCRATPATPHAERRHLSLVVER